MPPPGDHHYHYTRPGTSTLQPPPARDSFELGSLASSSRGSHRDSEDSDTSRAPSSRKLSFGEDDPLNPLHSASSHLTANRSGRSYSVGSAFDFAPAIFPLSSTNGGYTSLGAPSTIERSDTGNLEKQKSLTFLNGLALVVGMIIGIGIFSTPSQVTVNAGSPGAALIVWAVAGLLTWTGACAYAELGSALPLNGGAQLYLTKIFGNVAGFSYSWCTICIIKPGSAALISIIIGEYFVRAFVGADASNISIWILKGAAVFVAVLTALLNAISTKIAARSAAAFLIFKFAALLAVTIIGIVVASTGFSAKGKASPDWKTHGWFEGTNTNTAHLAVALYAGLWAYDGWDNANFVIGELRHPSRDLPRIIHTAMPIVIVSYMLANTAYFIVLPLSITSSSTTIAVAFGSQVLGKAGLIVFALMVTCSGFGSLSTSTFTTSRLVFAAAKEGYLPKVFGTLGFLGKHIKSTLPSSAAAAAAHTSASDRARVSRGKRFLASLCADDASGSYFYTPVFALLLNLVITIVYIAIGNFGTLVTFCGMASYVFYFLTVLGLLVLRVKEPHLPRPYKCWVTTPVIFCCVSLFLLSRSIVAQPWSVLAFATFQVIGLLVYFIIKARRSEKNANSIRPHIRTNDSSDSSRPWWRFWRRT